jgi:flagellar biogenesis protein FliO
MRGQGSSAAIKIVAAKAVGWQSSLQIVEADGQRFLVAAGRSGITAIGRLTPTGPGFTDLLDATAGSDLDLRSKS